MGITDKATKAIYAEIRLVFQRRVEAIIRSLQYLGEECVNEARDHPGYTDQTAALRSSIGYVVLQEGRIIYEDFKQSGKVSEGKEDKKAEGMLQGQRLASKLSKEFPRGLALIVVAGMNYASYVEAMGKNVLSSAELLAEREVPRMLKDLGLTI